MGLRKWEDMKTDCLVKVFQKVGLKGLFFDLPFVCKSWYQATLILDCWKYLDFSNLFEQNPFLYYKNMTEYEENMNALDEDDCIEMLAQPSLFFEVPCFQQRHKITEMIKFAVNRSSGCAVLVTLPYSCTLEVMECISNRCTNLKKLMLPDDVLLEHTGRQGRMPELVANWKDLVVLHLCNRYCSIKGMLAQVSIYCNSFSTLIVEGEIGNEEASAITELVPKIKHLRLTQVSWEGLKVILAGCRELEVLHIVGLINLEGDDEILKMASHIKSFKWHSLSGFELEPHGRMVSRENSFV